MVDTAISTLSMGTSHYATECIVAALKGTPRDTGLDLNLLEEINDYLNDLEQYQDEQYVQHQQSNRSM